MLQNYLLPALSEFIEQLMQAAMHVYLYDVFEKHRDTWLAEVRKRIAPYCTPVTQETLLRSVD